MPIANSYPIGELMTAVRDYVKLTGRRVVFEYALIDGLNSLPEHARELARLVSGPAVPRKPDPPQPRGRA